MITFGVAQGIVLAPILFNININSMSEQKAIFYSAEWWQEQKLRKENDCHIIELFHFKKPTLNVDKTKYLPFTPYTNKLPNMGHLVIHTFQRKISKTGNRGSYKIGSSDIISQQKGTLLATF